MYSGTAARFGCVPCIDKDRLQRPTRRRAGGPRVQALCQAAASNVKSCEVSVERCTPEELEIWKSQLRSNEVDVVGCVSALNQNGVDGAANGNNCELCIVLAKVVRAR